MKRLNIKINAIIINNKPNNLDKINDLAALISIPYSYRSPRSYISTNVMGTLNILECIKGLKKKCISVIITSDKSYKNLELSRGYKENDILGGHDPYSASKACAELIIQCYLNSFLYKKKNLRISIARAGNVIGGGDWSKNRLIPDSIRS